MTGEGVAAAEEAERVVGRGPEAAKGEAMAREARVVSTGRLFVALCRLDKPWSHPSL